jgi:serine/threonine-protein kinase
MTDPHASMSDPTSLTPPADRDERLARLLADLSDQDRCGLAPDVEACAREHPDLADELRGLWALAQITDAFAQSPCEAEPPQEPPPPPRSFGDYELLEEIGRGGMGVVFRARQKSLDRIVALKMVLRGELATPADLVRFRTEAEAAARLDHPHIVAVHEVGEIDGRPFFSMRHVAGTTLAARIASGPLPPRVAAGMIASVARAVHHAHQAGILHRDLKPSNILLDLSGQPYVTDFGLAKRVEAGPRLTHSGAILGTPSYMPPEQASGNRGPLGPTADVYSLGAILYELLTGRPPFQAATAVDTLLMVLDQEPVPPRLLNPSLDRELEIVCLRCLQKPPDLRYPTAEALAADLEAFLAGEPIAARPNSVTFFFNRLLRETHHAAVLENWGLLWMWHSLVVFCLCAVTQGLNWCDVKSAWPYLGLWSIGFGLWAAIFWMLRWRGGPVTFVERQIAHVWAASTISSVGLFVVEIVMNLPVLTLSPVLALFGGTVFLVKAATLSGTFYVAATAMFLTAVLMAMLPSYNLLIFGTVSALCFFIPGWKYYRQRARGLPAAE